MTKKWQKVKLKSYVIFSALKVHQIDDSSASREVDVHSDGREDRLVGASVGHKDHVVVGIDLVGHVESVALVVAAVRDAALKLVVADAARSDVCVAVSADEDLELASEAGVGNVGDLELDRSWAHGRRGKAKKSSLLNCEREKFDILYL